MYLNRTRLVQSYRRVYTERRPTLADGGVSISEGGLSYRQSARRASDAEMWLSEKIAMSFAAAISQPLRGMSRRNALVKQARAKKRTTPKDPLAAAEAALSRAAQRNNAASDAQTANRRGAMKPGGAEGAVSSRARIDATADSARDAMRRRASEVQRLRSEAALERRAKDFKERTGVSLSDHNDKLIAANRAAMAKDAKRRAAAKPKAAPASGNNHAGAKVADLRAKLKGKAKGLGRMRKADLVALADRHFGKSFGGLSAKVGAHGASKLNPERPMDKFERSLLVKAYANEALEAKGRGLLGNTSKARQKMRKLAQNTGDHRAERAAKVGAYLERRFPGGDVAAPGTNNFGARARGMRFGKYR